MPNITIFLCFDLPLTVVFHHPPPAIAASSLKWVQLDPAFHRWWFSSDFSNILRKVDIDNSIVNKDRTMTKFACAGRLRFRVEFFKTLRTDGSGLHYLGRDKTPNMNSPVRCITMRWTWERRDASFLSYSLKFMNTFPSHSISLPTNSLSLPSWLS